MAVESAADLAGFFAPGEFGVAATYTPAGGPAVAVTVQHLQPLVAADLGGADVMVRRRSVLLQAVEVATPVRGDTVTIDAAVYTVVNAELDGLGVLWTVGLKGG